MQVLLFVIMIIKETYILTIVIVSFKNITQNSDLFYFERALIFNTVFITNYFDNTCIQWFYKCIDP